MYLGAGKLILLGGIASPSLGGVHFHFYTFRPSSLEFRSCCLLIRTACSYIAQHIYFCIVAMPTAMHGKLHHATYGTSNSFNGRRSKSKLLEC